MWCRFIDQTGAETESVFGGQYKDDQAGLKLQHDRKGLLSMANMVRVLSADEINDWVLAYSAVCIRARISFYWHERYIVALSGRYFYTTWYPRVVLLQNSVYFQLHDLLHRLLPAQI